MAKKKTAPSKAASKTGSKAKAASAATATRKSTDKKSAAGSHKNGPDHGHPHNRNDGHDHSECCNIELDDVAASAVEMAQSKKFSDELELAVNKSVFLAVRKFYREHGASLSAEQAQNVALVLFGE